MVARTVRPAPGRSPPEVPAGPLKAEAGLAKTAKAAPPPAAHGFRPPRPEAPPGSIEPPGMDADPMYEPPMEPPAPCSRPAPAGAMTGPRDHS